MRNTPITYYHLVWCSVLNTLTATPWSTAFMVSRLTISSIVSTNWPAILLGCSALVGFFSLSMRPGDIPVKFLHCARNWHPICLVYHGCHLRNDNSELCDVSVHVLNSIPVDRGTASCTRGSIGRSGIFNQLQMTGSSLGQYRSTICGGCFTSHVDGLGRGRMIVFKLVFRKWFMLVGQSAYFQHTPSF